MSELWVVWPKIRGSEILDTLPDLDLIVGTQKFHHLPDYLDKISEGKSTENPIILDLGRRTGVAKPNSQS